MVMRASAGAGQGFACQHSQMLDHWFRGTPGLKVCVPSGARTAYGLLRAAIDDPDPVIVLEPRILYGEREEFDGDPHYRIRLGTAEIARPGRDATLVTAGAMLKVALAAAEKTNVNVEVIDLLSLAPWDRGAVTGSVTKTGRLVTLEEAPAGTGWGGDVAAAVTSDAFAALKAPPHRITLPDAPIPYSGALEKRYLPDADYVAAQIDALVSSGRAPAAWWKEAS
jgi:pyruvate dehydrogenase E1 component beta subunit